MAPLDVSTTTVPSGSVITTRPFAIVAASPSASTRSKLYVGSSLTAFSLFFRLVWIAAVNAAFKTAYCVP